jgi:4'-phosphopantetheinyl transferase
MTTQAWEPPPLAPTASAAEVHAWRFPLEPAGEVVARFRSTLSEEETTRADRFRAAADRGRYIVGRGSLRAILGLYLCERPERLAFGLGPHGKPALAGDRLEFNLSHAGGLGVLAVALGRCVGVDIEPIRPIDSMEGIVARFFSERERSDVAALPPDRRLDAFFRTWTSKEAYLKATGLGLTVSLEGFDVEANPEAPPRLLAVAGRPDEPGRWTMRDLEPGPGYVGTIAVEGSDWRLRRFGCVAGPDA